MKKLESMSQSYMLYNLYPHIRIHVIWEIISCSSVIRQVELLLTLAPRARRPVPTAAVSPALHATRGRANRARLLLRPLSPAHHGTAGERLARPPRPKVALQVRDRSESQ